MATCELQWPVFLLKDLRVDCTRPAVFYCDSHSALHIAANPMFHEHTKHLDIDCHIVREKVQSGLMRLLTISTHDQQADIFTKALPFRSFVDFLPKVRMLDIFQHQLASGGVLEHSTVEKEEESSPSIVAHEE